MQEYTFPENFLWGSATASYQVEGAAYEDGRGQSIWDTFTRIPGKVYAGENGDVAVDQYHRFPEDIELMKQAGLQAYRFSIAWPRILPNGTGAINRKGIAYYRQLAEALIQAGIQPTATLYHWDLPQVLEDEGGWTVRETSYAFADFARVCFQEFGDLIHSWITMNEPLCSAYLGYESGTHAPGIQDKNLAAAAVHHLNLGHGLAVQAFREGNYPGEIGITWNLIRPRPATRSPQDMKAAELATDRNSRMFTGPITGKGYPQDYLDLAGLTIPVKDGDMKVISAKIDFAGLNYYSEHAVTWDDNSPHRYRNVPEYQDVTDMGWAIVPDGLYRLLLWMRDELPGTPLYITENGCALQDVPSVDAHGRTRVYDAKRITYLRDHFAAAARAISDGVPLKGYYVWSFIDNFEWSFGYSKRFGIVYCDYQSLERTPKDSFYYIRDVIAGYERFQA